MRAAPQWHRSRGTRQLLALPTCTMRAAALGPSVTELCGCAFVSVGPFHTLVDDDSTDLVIASDRPAFPSRVGRPQRTRT